MNKFRFEFKLIKACILTMLLPMALVACVQNSPGSVRAADQKLTTGRVQKYIRVGMSSAEVAEIMGSPNIVSTDEQRHEVWIYDKISTDYVHNRGAMGLGLLVSKLGLGASGSSEHSSSNQKTLTVVIKFDEQAKVRDFSYHQSSF